VVALTPTEDAAALEMPEAPQGQDDGEATDASPEE
jgi:hypothetical protein